VQTLAVCSVKQTPENALCPLLSCAGTPNGLSCAIVCDACNAMISVPRTKDRMSILPALHLPRELPHAEARVNGTTDGEVDLPDDYFIQMSGSAARLLCWQPLPEPGPRVAAWS
jgi:hypothetical protein